MIRRTHLYPLLPNIPENAPDSNVHHPMQTVEFADIRIRAALPLHPYLYKHPHLFLRLVADGSVCGDTAGVNGDLAGGVWEFNGGLYAPRVKQSLNVGVLTGAKGPGIPVVCVTIKVAELLERAKACRNGRHGFDIFDSGAPIQLKLVMTCSIKLSSILDVVSNAAGDKERTIHNHSRNNEADFDPERIRLLSREELERLYVKTKHMPHPDDSKAHQLSLLGQRFHALHGEEQGKADLEKAISIHEEAMQFTGAFHPLLAVHTRSFAVALLERSQQSSDHIDIERAISYCHTALRFTEDLDEARPISLSNLGTALQLRFKRAGDIADLENSILYQREAIRVMPSDHSDDPSLLTNLGISLQSLFERSGDLAVLEDAISNQRRAVQLMPDNYIYKPSLFNNLGFALQSRFKRSGGLADLENAISNYRQAVQLMPDGHFHRPNLLKRLGLVLQSRFERSGDLADSNEAISNHRQAVQLTPDGHPESPDQCNSLGEALRSRFGRLGDLVDLEDAISNFRQAVQLTPNSHSDNPSRLNSLGIALRSRFERLGGLADLEDAISNHRQAVQLIPDGHSHRPGLFISLGHALQCRYDRLGVLADLEDALSNFQQAVQLMPDDDLNKLALFDNLGLALRSRFERLDDLADLQDAISNHQQAVQVTPDGHPERPNQYNSLGVALLSRFKRLEVLVDLEDAISNFRQADLLTPESHPDKPTRFNNLAFALWSRFERLGDIADLEDSISNHQQGVQLAPNGHPGKSNQLRNLALAFISRFERLGVLSDLESAFSALSTAANSISGPALVRFETARTWAKVAEEQSRSPLDAFQCAIDLLPRIAWVGLAVNDQHALLAKLGGIVRDAVAAAIRCEEYETAVVWAEQGRSIVWQNLLGLRSPVEDLHEAHPDLADQLRSIATQLEGSGSHLEVPMSSAGDVSVNYSKLAIDWDDIVEEVRRIPRFEDFLKAKSFRQLAPAAHEGPVVILNVKDAQCDALVLISDDSVECKVSAVHIPLERFSYEKSKKMFQTLTELLSSAGVRERNNRKTGRVQSRTDGEAKFKVILGILWTDVVKPVIEGLAFQIEPKRPPRIWWCVTGLLAFLPIHAAGLYDTLEVGERISDYVISSYTPTLNAILQPADPMGQDDFQVLTVAQASAPGAQPIPMTEDEVRIVQRLTDGVRRVNLMRENATVERVREEMTKSNWIHLACHGQQNRDDPMKSGFLLRDKILKLSEIVKMSLPKAEFAFLSACQTAMGDEKVAEESVHLAAGMLLSGCRGVIATTWSIRDDDGPRVAEDVYSRIFNDGKPNSKEAAYALCEAVKRLRDSGAKCTSWVPFIHIGR